VTETVARLLFAAIWLPFAAMRIHYHRAAGAKPRGLTTPDEGRLFGVIRWGLALPWFVSLLVWLVWPPALRWAAFELPAGARFTGAALFAAGALLVFWTNRELGANFSSTLILRDEHELIQRGPYRLVRHPMYTAFLIMLTGMLLLSANWLIGGGGIAFILLLMAVRTPREERMLLGRFGDEYRRYMERTGRYLPRLLPRRAGS
jgi:protein-S-isoprenylcysteine O-methyltransferase Ste14